MIDTQRLPDRTDSTRPASHGRESLEAMLGALGPPTGGGRCTQLGRGESSEVWLVDGEWVVRLPRHEQARELFRWEGALLRRLQGRLPLPIPEPLDLPPSVEDGEALVYPAISGEPLWLETYRGMSQAARSRIAGQLAEFLRAIHGISPGEVVDLPLPTHERKEQWVAMFARIEAALFPLMSTAGRARAAAEFAPLLSGEFDPRWEPRLRHGDFGTCNILCDAAAGTVTGVIDFGGSGLGDPAVDLGALLGYGEEMVALIGEDYPELMPDRPRAEAYAKTYALQAALFGAEQGDAEALQAGLAGYR